MCECACEGWGGSKCVYVPESMGDNTFAKGDAEGLVHCAEAASSSNSSIRLKRLTRAGLAGRLGCSGGPHRFRLARGLSWSPWTGLPFSTSNGRFNVMQAISRACCAVRYS